MNKTQAGVCAFAVDLAEQDPWAEETERKAKKLASNSKVLPVMIRMGQGLIAEAATRMGVPEGTVWDMAMESWEGASGAPDTRSAYGSLVTRVLEIFRAGDLSEEFARFLMVTPGTDVGVGFGGALDFLVAFYTQAMATYTDVDEQGTVYPRLREGWLTFA